MNLGLFSSFSGPDDDPEMPFGKYAGSRLSSLPADYLAWAVGEAEADKFKPEWLNAAILREWRKR